MLLVRDIHAHHYHTHKCLLLMNEKFSLQTATDFGIYSDFPKSVAVFLMKTNTERSSVNSKFINHTCMHPIKLLYCIICIHCMII